jgi:LemA protein
MTNLKKYSIIALTLLLASCSSSDEGIIKDYLKKHLNDASSYEPVEFNTGNLAVLEKVPAIEMQLRTLGEVYQRRADLIPNIVNTAKSYLTTDVLKQLIELRAECTATGQPSLSKLVEVTTLEDKFSKTIHAAIAELKMKKISNEDILEIEAQLEGTENRIKVENEKVNDMLNLYEVVNHKYRAKNEFGALMLVVTTFVIDKKSHQVIETYNN